MNTFAEAALEAVNGHDVVVAIVEAFGRSDSEEQARMINALAASLTAGCGGRRLAVERQMTALVDRLDVAGEVFLRELVACLDARDEGRAQPGASL